MKKLLLTISLLLSLYTIVSAESKEKMKTVSEYKIFFNSKINAYIENKEISIEELISNLDRGQNLHIININHYGNILFDNEITPLKKLKSKLPQSAQAAFVVNVDSLQLYGKEHLYVLDKLYDYYFAKRKKSNIANYALDNKIPYLVICQTEKKNSNNVIPPPPPQQPVNISDTNNITETTQEIENIDEQPETVITPDEEITDEYVEPELPLANEEIATNIHVSKDEGKEALIILILAFAAMILNIIATKSRNAFSDWPAFFIIAIIIELAISITSIYLFFNMINGMSLSSIIDGFWMTIVAMIACIFIAYQQFMLFMNIVTYVNENTDSFNLRFSIWMIIALGILLGINLITGNSILESLDTAFVDSIILDKGLIPFIGAIGAIFVIFCFIAQMIHFIVRLQESPGYMITMLLIYPIIAIGLIINAIFATMSILIFAVVLFILKAISSSNTGKNAVCLNCRYYNNSSSHCSKHNSTIYHPSSEYCDEHSY